MNYKDLIEKTAVSRDEDTDTRFMRDRFVPGLKRLPLNLAGTLAGGAIGAAVGGRKGSMAGQMTGSVVGTVAANQLTSGAQRQMALNKLSKKYLGEKASLGDSAKMHGQQLLTAALGNNPASKGFVPISVAMNTPEAIIQKRRRQMAEAENTQA